MSRTSKGTVTWRGDIDIGRPWHARYPLHHEPEPLLPAEHRSVPSSFVWDDAYAVPLPIRNRAYGIGLAIRVREARVRWSPGSAAHALGKAGTASSKCVQKLRTSATGERAPGQADRHRHDEFHRLPPLDGRASHETGLGGRDVCR